MAMEDFARSTEMEGEEEGTGEKERGTGPIKSRRGTGDVKQGEEQEKEKNMKRRNTWRGKEDEDTVSRRKMKRNRKNKRNNTWEADEQGKYKEQEVEDKEQYAE